MVHMAITPRGFLHFILAHLFLDIIGGEDFFQGAAHGADASGQFFPVAVEFFLWPRSRDAFRAADSFILFGEEGGDGPQQVPAVEMADSFTN
jgi:hypothetical protein